MIPPPVFGPQGQESLGDEGGSPAASRQVEG